jgi:hypothetical protein
MRRTLTKPVREKAKEPPVSSKTGRAVARLSKPKPQSLASDQFFYFFLRLRKGEVRRVVQRVRSLYPKESPEQHARRLILAQCSLSLVGGAILYLPQLFPVIGNVWKMAGFVGGASMLARLNLYLILEIALLYGEDIDDQARVPEMMTVVAASGLSAASPFLVNALDWHPAAAIPASGLTATAVSKLIGESAIAFYKARRATAPHLEEGVAQPAMAAAG